MQSDYARLRDTPFDLYTERDRLPWYFGTGALASSWLALGGYVLFALVFTSPKDNIKTTRAVLAALAGICLVIGYVGSVATALLSRSLLFCFDAVLLPILTSSFMGLCTIVMNYGLHHSFPIPTKAYIYVPLITACITTVFSALFSYIVYRKIKKIKSMARGRRERVSRWERQSYGGNGDPASATELLPMPTHIPEDEAQRRQLLRLLFSRDSGLSPGPEATSSTYRIELPFDDNEANAKYVAVARPRPRSGSLPARSGRWKLSNMLGRGRSPAADGTKEYRERRREEIERASIYQSPPTGWSQTAGAPLSPTRLGSSVRYA